VNRTTFPGSRTGLVSVTSALALSQRLLAAQSAAQARHLTTPVAAARVRVQLDQCSCAASSPSSAQVKIMLLGLMIAGPAPQIATAGLAGRAGAGRAHAVAAFAAGASDRPMVISAAIVSAQRQRALTR